MCEEKLYVTYPGSDRRYPAVKVKCCVCGKDILRRITEVKPNKKIFCSKNCRDKYNENKSVYLTCATCGKIFKRLKSHLSNSRHKIYFCSRKCKDEGQRIGGIKEIKPRHYSDKITSKYRLTAFRNYEHKCAVCGYNKFTQILEVHHKDKNRDNNRDNNELDNLIILCPNCHRLVHHKLIKI